MRDIILNLSALQSADFANYKTNMRVRVISFIFITIICSYKVV
jgi:hypothetical protein